MVTRTHFSLFYPYFSLTEQYWEAGELKPQNWLIENAYKFYQQALADMGALRIEVYDNGHQFWMPAAGIPWFVAVFGRDSIIASLQAIAVDHEFARGTLLKLAQLQATELDDWHDAQPGKMLHEMRRDELTTLNLLPYHPYYGTVDTTILWIVTLAEAYNWNADVSMLDECRAPLTRKCPKLD
jgi:glycogen debranching enzyme